MGVGADGQELAAQLAVKAQDAPRGHQVGQAVFERGGIELNPLAVGNRLPQDPLNERQHLFIRVRAAFVIALDHVEVPQDRIVFVAPHNVVNRLIVGGLVLVLGAALLEFVVPKLFVPDLMVAQDHKIKRITGEIVLELAGRFGLHAKFNARTDGNTPGVLLLHGAQGAEIGRVITVQVGLYTVIDVFGKTDLVEAQRQRALHHVLHGGNGIVAERGVKMVIGKHGSPSPAAKCLPAYSIIRGALLQDLSACRAGLSHQSYVYTNSRAQGSPAGARPAIFPGQIAACAGRQSGLGRYDLCKLSVYRADAKFCPQAVENGAGIW